MSWACGCYIYKLISRVQSFGVWRPFYSTLRASATIQSCGGWFHIGMELSIEKGESCRRRSQALGQEWGHRHQFAEALWWDARLENPQGRTRPVFYLVRHVAALGAWHVEAPPQHRSAARPYSGPAWLATKVRDRASRDGWTQWASVKCINALFPNKLII